MVKIEFPKRKRTADEAELEAVDDISVKKPVVYDISSEEDYEDEENSSSNCEIIDLSNVSKPNEAPFSAFKCPVCLEPPEELCATECGHMYCTECVFPAITSSNRATKTTGECAVCRQKVKYDRIMYMQMRINPEYSEPAEESA